MLSPYYKPEIDLLIEGRFMPQRGSFYFLPNVHDKIQDDTRDIFISLPILYSIRKPSLLFSPEKSPQPSPVKWFDKPFNCPFKYPLGLITGSTEIYGFKMAGFRELQHCGKIRVFWFTWSFSFHYPPSLAKSAKLAISSRNASRTLPTGPFRCFSMFISAIPLWGLSGSYSSSL